MDAVRQRQIMVRRAVGAGLVVVLLILIVLGIRGCLNERKQRGFENYARDLTAIVAQSDQLSHDFFARLSDPGNLSALSFEAEIKSYRGGAEDLTNRVEALDTPDELKGAQGELNLAFQLRSDALTGISDQISTALGTQGRSQAVQSIADYMQYFLASDVLYARARDQINAELEDQDISERVPESIFLADQRWLDPLEVSSALALVSSGSKKATSGTHGLALYQTTIQPGDMTLDPSSAATVTSTGPPELEVQVQNQGDSEESDIGVSFELTGGAQTISGDTTIPRIAPGGIQTASIPIQPDPDTGKALTLEVTVQPVVGEQISENNRSTYQVTFR
ncbi:MAG TPA: CARDB domain-containing protein [Solirubrobacterales bacterium]|nr:CARDB domain-containing protein [Solirubrobacterales bacterium]